MLWFVAFIVLTVVAGLLEPIVSAASGGHPDTHPDDILRAQYRAASRSPRSPLLLYSVRARDAALASSERLLLNVLPAPIAERLKRHEGRIAEAHDEVTVLFADVVDFTPFAERTPPGTRRGRPGRGLQRVR